MSITQEKQVAAPSVARRDAVAVTPVQQNDPPQRGGSQQQPAAPIQSRLQGFLFHLDTKFGLALLSLWIFGILLILGAILFENGIYLPDKHAGVIFTKEMGILFFAIATASLVHDRFLRHHSLKEIEKVFSERFESKLNDVIENSLPEQITKVISAQLPPRYANIKASGIEDAFPDLQADRLFKKIRNLGKDSKVFILKMWLGEIDRLEAAIREAISNGCKFKIIILHPDSLDVFRKRGKFLEGTTVNSDIMKANVIDSIKRLKLLKESLPAEDKDKLEVKLHEDFVSVSIFGVDEKILVGFYLHRAVAENNIQLKISGRHTRYYKAFTSHFDLQWASETNKHLEEYTPPGYESAGP